MNVRTAVIVAVLAGAAAVAAAAVAYAPPPGPESGGSGDTPPPADPLALDFDYAMNSRLSDALAAEDISMSSPVRLGGAQDIRRYCTFFDDPQKQALIEYCTSTELRDGEERFLGNVHMVGTAENPRMVIAILEASFEGTGGVHAVFNAVINNTVCRCWEDLAPGGFSSASAWIDALKEFHRQASPPPQTTTKSAVLTLDGLKVQSEVTSIEGAHVWKLFVAR